MYRPARRAIKPWALAALSVADVSGVKLYGLFERLGLSVRIELRHVWKALPFCVLPREVRTDSLPRATDQVRSGL